MSNLESDAALEQKKRLLERLKQAKDKQHESAIEINSRVDDTSQNTRVKQEDSLMDESVNIKQEQNSQVSSETGIDSVTDLAKPVRTSTKMFELDLDLYESKGYVTVQEKRTRINEEFRSIKRKLLNNAFGALSKTIKNSNLIMVTSAHPHEGKTFTAINLALSIALEKDKRVLLVDADILRPNVSNELNLMTSVGLTEYLRGEERRVSDIMYRTNIDRLRIIPAGEPHYLSNELLASERMLKLTEEFTSRYSDRVVVIDAPPLLGVNETSILAELCGQGVFVVEDSRCKMSDVKEGMAVLPESMAVGFVLNKVVDERKNEYYGYYAPK